MNDKCNALILKQTDYRENDALILAYCENFGLLTFVARGIRKMGSKNAGSLFPFTESELLFDYKEGSDIVALHSAHLLKSYRHVQSDLTCGAIANVIAELAGIIGREAREDAELNDTVYRLLKAVLSDLNSTQDIFLPLSLFLANALNLLGIPPEVDECAICGSTKVNAISVEDGGFVCSNCYSGPKESPAFLKQFRLLNKASSEHLPILKQYGPYPFHHAEILYQFLNMYLSVNLRSWDFLKEIIVLK